MFFQRGEEVAKAKSEKQADEQNQGAADQATNPENPGEFAASVSADVAAAGPAFMNPIEVLVSVEDIQPATVTVEDGPGWEDRAKEAYRTLRSFISTRRQWTVRRLGPATDDNGQPIPVADPEDADIEATI